MLCYCGIDNVCRHDCEISQENIVTMYMCSCTGLGHTTDSTTNGIAARKTICLIIVYSQCAYIHTVYSCDNIAVVNSV